MRLLRVMLLGVLVTLVCSACTAVAERREGEPRQRPLRAVGTLPAWAVQTPPSRLASPTFAPTAPLDRRDLIRDVRTGAERIVEVVRDNDGRVSLTRNGTAVWARTTEGLVLERLDGSVLERIEGARDLREAPDGSARVYATSDGWVVEAPGRTSRLAGAVQFPSFSFDARYLAFERTEGRTRSVYVLDVRSGEEAAVALGIGRCHCTTTDAYGFPRWASTASAFTYSDAGPFEAPPEERAGGQFLYDVASRRATRATAAMPGRAGCEQRYALTSSDGAYEVAYTRSCRLAGR